ncbi:hypothetical protein A33M_1099 [Rhodovulum sp. PH10]|nr:hypothetical protein A33M_1099 [Rhodovulum sp. PH10]
MRRAGTLVRPGGRDGTRPRRHPLASRHSAEGAEWQPDRSNGNECF